MKSNDFVKRLFNFRFDIYDIWSGYDVSLGVDSIVIRDGDAYITFWYPGGESTDMFPEMTHNFSDTSFPIETVLKICEAVNNLFKIEEEA